MQSLHWAAEARALLWKGDDSTLGCASADDLMQSVSSAARTIAFRSDDTWRRIESSLRGPIRKMGRRDREVAPGARRSPTWSRSISTGFPGDHTEVGMELVAAMGHRMGYPSADVDTWWPWSNTISCFPMWPPAGISMTPR